MGRRLNGILLRVANKVIVRIRAGKRLNQIRSWIQNNEIKTRDDMKRLVAMDWKRAQNARFGTADNENDIRNMKFEFNF